MGKISVYRNMSRIILTALKRENVNVNVDDQYTNNIPKIPHTVTGRAIIEAIK
jgi:hypothetical protein